MEANKNILLAFYGDDFTGSTDALEFLCKAGANAILFIEPPTLEQLKKYPNINAYGVAGKTRALPPNEMEEILLPAFEQMKSIGAKHIHYKICSTFDSSPMVGSIGKAIDCGLTVFKNEITPVLGGMPALGRFCVFGNLFAKMGIGSDGEIFRIDKHPSMSKHPVTPMEEADLRIHLGKQTGQKISLIDYLHQSKNNIEDWKANTSIALLDAVSVKHLEKIGEWLNYLQKDEQLFSVGSSGIEMALGKFWNKTNLLVPKNEWPEIKSVTPTLIISGSCSPVTKAQIEFSVTNGFEEVIINARKICETESFDKEIIELISSKLKQEKNVIIHTGEKQNNTLSSEIIGTVMGMIVKEVLNTTIVKRVIFSGGDTSSYAARALEIEAVEMIAPYVIGAPLCRVISSNKKVNGLEVNFKGGQVGGENYFCFTNGTTNT